MKSKQIHFPFTLTNTHTKKRCWTDAKRFYWLSEFIFVCFFFLFFFLNSHLVPPTFLQFIQF